MTSEHSGHLSPTQAGPALAVASGRVRPSAIAGTWYPAGAGELAATVDSLLAKVEAPEPSGEVVAVLAPHAGYLYSGAVTAAAFRQVQRLPVERVVVVSPSHHPYGSAVVLPNVDAFATPLGSVPIDRRLLSRLAARLGDMARPVTHDTEHSLEIQLPFLQRCLATFQLVPVMIAQQSGETADLVARALVHTLREAGVGDGTLLVASSDLSHYRDYRTASRMDRAFLDYVERLDAPGLIGAAAGHEVEACGTAAVAAIMLAALELGATTARVLRYANSGDVTGDVWRVVGYGAAAFYREELPN